MNKAKKKKQDRETLVQLIRDAIEGRDKEKIRTVLDILEAYDKDQRKTSKKKKR